MLSAQSDTLSGVLKKKIISEGEKKQTIKPRDTTLLTLLSDSHF